MLGAAGEMGTHAGALHKDDKLLPEPGTKQPGLLATAYGSCAF